MVVFQKDIDAPFPASLSAVSANLLSLPLDRAALVFFARSLPSSATTPLSWYTDRIKLTAFGILHCWCQALRR